MRRTNPCRGVCWLTAESASYFRTYDLTILRLATLFDCRRLLAYLYAESDQLRLTPVGLADGYVDASFPPSCILATVPAVKGLDLGMGDPP